MARFIFLSLPFLLTGCPEQTVKAFNAEPEAEITSHADGSEVLEGFRETFRGAVSDPDDSADELTATWYLDGDVLCESAAPDSDGITTCEAVIPAGASQLVLEVQDPGNAAGSDQVILEVVATDSPEAQITAPTTDGVYYSDMLITFEGLVSDGEDAATDLVASWESNLDGTLKVDAEPSDSGEITGFGYLSEGEHAIELNVTDTTGKTGSDSVIISVGPPNSAPSCEITAPEDGASGQAGDTVTFEATVADVDVAADWLTVRWTSDKDGDLGESTPDSTGGVIFLTSALSVEAHVVTMTVTDELGATCSDNVVYTVGTPPEVSAVTIEPDPATAEDVLLCSWTFTDADGGTDQSTLEWSVNGTSAGTDPTLSGAFVYGDEVTCTVTAFDGTDVGNTDSATLIIANSPPVLSEVTLTPDSASEDDTLVCTPGTISDADGTVGFDTTFSWWVNGIDIGETTDTLTGDFFDKGDDVVCQVIPNDGDDDGDAVASNTVTIDNTVPSIASVTIDPANPRPTDTLSCSYAGFDDADGDADVSTYSWTIGGSEVGTSDTLTGAFVTGDAVTCTVTPDDGEDVGTALSDTVTIENSLPEVVSVTLSPSTVYTNDTITATVSTTDADGDGVSVTYEWWVDGSTVAETGSTLDGATYFDKEQVVYVVVTPNDGYEDGAAVSSSSVVVSNTAPGAPTIAIDPTEPVAGEDDLICWIDLDSTDDDGDAISYTVEWEVDGVAYTGAITTAESGDTVPASDTLGEQVWTCTMTPNDGDDDGASASASIEVIEADCFEGWDDIEVDLVDAGYSFIGEESGDHSGRSVSSAGDVDGDGLDDLLIGAGYNDRSDSSAGAAYVILAASLAGDMEIDLSDADYILVGVDKDDTAGLTVAAAGDVDGDGLGDILVGAEAEDSGGSNAGGTYVILGSSLGASQVISLDDADYLLYGENSFDYSASGSSASISSAGDVDGDGLSDILIGAPANSDGGSYAGKAYLVLGSSLGSSSTLSLSDADYLFYGESAGDNAGTSVASAGDVDGDGLDDILVGAFSEDTHGGDTGATYLFLGASLGSTTDLSLGAADTIIYGETEGDYSSWGIAGPGDVDGDGLDDILVGAKLNDEGSSDAGKVYVIFGSSLGTSGAIMLSDADVMMWGELGESVGHSIFGAGDVDGDGLADLWIGAYGTSPGGSAYLVLGATVEAGVNLQLTDDAIQFMGENTSDVAGYFVNGAGDVNGDGLSDLLVGAYGNDDGGSAAGKTYLVITPSTCNTPPRGTDISVSPTDPVEGVDDLVCTIDAEAYDAEGESVNYAFEWEVDGVPYMGATSTTEPGDTVPASDTFAEEEWTCIVTPHDGTDDGFPSMATVEIGTPFDCDVSVTYSGDVDWPADDGLCDAGLAYDVSGDLIIDASATHLSGASCLCTITGNMTLMENEDLVNFEGLENLQSIGGNVYIYDNPALEDFTGLDHLASIGGYLALYYADSLVDFSGLGSLASLGSFDLYDNDRFTNFSGLDNLSVISGYFHASYNDAFADFTGLETLTTIGQSFRMQYNASQVDFTGLENLSSIGTSFGSGYSASLVSMDGLDGLRTIGTNMSINDNTALTDVTAMHTVTSVGGELVVANNTSLLTSDAESLRDAIGTGNIGGTIIISGNK